uniref:Uncharacterized protein n=1 Tax=Zea mays TaxID=4577 RepID=C0PAI2_MAIZE|nr:unknown [Zea mays]
MNLSTATPEQYRALLYTLLRCVCSLLPLGLCCLRWPWAHGHAHAPLRRPSRNDHGDGVAVRAAGALLGHSPAACGTGTGRLGVHDGAAARRARAAGQQPGVDARDVERVAAPRQHAHLLAVRELAEADGAHVPAPGPLLLVVFRIPADVNLHGDAPQRALLDPAPDARAGRRGDARRRRHLAAPGRGPASAPEREPGQRVERDGEQQRQEQRRQQDHRVGVEGRVDDPGRRRARASDAASAVHGRPRRLGGVPAVHVPPALAHECSFLPAVLCPRQ